MSLIVCPIRTVRLTILLVSALTGPSVSVPTPSCVCSVSACALLETQWVHHRWVFGDAVSPDLVLSPLWLPQGGPSLRVLSWWSCCFLCVANTVSFLSPGPSCILMIVLLWLPAWMFCNVLVPLSLATILMSLKLKCGLVLFRPLLLLRVIPSFGLKSWGCLSVWMVVRRVPIKSSVRRGARFARRLAVFKCSHSFKASLAALVLAPVVTWGALRGHVPADSAVSSLCACFPWRSRVRSAVEKALTRSRFWVWW